MRMRALALAAVCCALLPAIATSPAQGGIADDLLGYWHMDGDLASATSGDYDGTLIGDSAEPVATFVPGKVGQAIDLDKADSQRIEITGDNGDFRLQGSSVSVSAWFTVENFDEGWQALVAKGEGDSWRVARHNSNSVMAYAGGSGDIPGDASGPDVTGGGWHHVVAISEHEVSTRLWVDGQLVATGDPPTIGDDADRGLSNLLIGGNPDTGPPPRTWNGNIDEVAVWSRMLSDDEVAYLWNDGAGNLVPEPSSLMLAALGLLGLLGHRRRK